MLLILVYDAIHFHFLDYDINFFYDLKAWVL